MIKKLIKESVLEVGYAIYMSEVYKMPMVSMSNDGRTCDLKGLYTTLQKCKGLFQTVFVWLSKNLDYEKP